MPDWDYWQWIVVLGVAVLLYGGVRMPDYFGEIGDDIKDFFRGRNKDADDDGPG